jgi:hypothetical protein
MLTINLDTKTQHELKLLLDQVKVSDLSFEDKKNLIDEIQARITGVQAMKQSQILKEIDEGQGDMNDIGGGD